MFEFQNNEEIEVNADIRTIAAELEHFHHQNGGTRLLPNVVREDSPQSDWILFRIFDNASEASISLRPDRNGTTVLAVNVNESHLWGWILGMPGRSELGVNTYLGADTSPECESFCTKFIEYLEQSGYLRGDNPESKPKGGRPSYPDDEWARFQYYIEQRDIEDVFLEWESRPGVIKRNLSDTRDSFKKLLRTPPKKGTAS